MRKTLLPVALAALFLTACSPVTVNTSPSVVTVTADSSPAESSTPTSSPAPVTVTATHTAEPSTVTAHPSETDPAYEANAPVDPWIQTINTIMSSGAAEQLSGMDQTGCIESAGSRKSSWSNTCLTQLGYMLGTAEPILGWLESAHSEYGAPTDAQMREVVRQAKNLMNKQVENLEQAKDHDCLVYADPQRKIPRVKDGKMTQCFYFYTNDYWTQAADKLRPYVSQ